MRPRQLTLSFPSTLYLSPVLDLLLADVPPELLPLVRLGLQEALVNAAKHGNNLDPRKTIRVHYEGRTDGWCWVIEDQGPGCPSDCDCRPEGPEWSWESGRGLYILHQVFDRVEWCDRRQRLQLTKHLSVTRR
ncbi:MAG: ATP-binding protein [Gloeomargarita sp. SKYG98]|nr:ATP-binding protein [Gloeomargarita sp. SKYG98]